MDDSEPEGGLPTLPAGPHVVGGDPGLPSVLIQAWSNATEYDASGPVKVVLIDWMTLGNPSLVTRGALCAAWKAVWGLPDHQRRLVLNGLISIAVSRYPIRATFQAESGEHGLFDLGKPVVFDVTEQVLKMSPDEVDNFQDDEYPTDHLADDLPQRQSHHGSFRVEVKEAAMEFLNADENEEHERQRE
jgi:hypothetical protein